MKWSRTSYDLGSGFRFAFANKVVYYISSCSGIGQQKTLHTTMVFFIHFFFSPVFVDLTSTPTALAIKPLIKKSNIVSVL